MDSKELLREFNRRPEARRLPVRDRASLLEWVIDQCMTHHRDGYQEALSDELVAMEIEEEARACQ